MFIGQPLNFLLSKLNINGKVIYDGLVPLPAFPDTIYVNKMYFFFDARFYSTDVMDNEVQKVPNTLNPTPTVNFHIPYLTITFATPVSVLKSQILRGKPLFSWDWTPAKTAFYGTHVISDVQAEEY